MSSKVLNEKKKGLFNLILNSSNLVSGNVNNNIFRYNFPSGTVNISKGSKIAVASLSMFYSWKNISAALGNNSYTIIQPTLAGTTNITVTMPDGFYDVVGLNAYLQYALIQAGFYLLDANGNYVYYLQWQTNSSLYAVELDEFVVPTALPTGYSNPATMTFPAVATTPQVTIPNSALQNNIGFLAGTYPAAMPQASNYSVTSTFTPQITSIESVIMTCSLVRNIYSSPNTVLFTFSSNGTTFGNLITVNIPEFNFVSIYPGNYPSFEITFLDQSFNPLPIQDTNLVVQLVLETDDDYGV